jgi:hypothetical protein
MTSVAELPFPHGLFHTGCPFADDHQRILDEIGDREDRYRWAFERFVREVGPRMGDASITSLTGISLRGLRSRSWRRDVATTKTLDSSPASWLEIVALMMRRLTSLIGSSITRSL